MKTELFKTTHLHHDGFQYKIEINHDGTVIYVNGKLVNQSLLTKSSNKPGGSFWITLIDGNKFKKLTHILVALAWVENPNNFTKVLHIDTNTVHNHYKNLMWGEQVHVAINMKVMGRNYIGMNTRNNSKLSETDVLKIIERIKAKETLKNIAHSYGVSDMSISRIKKRYSIVVE